MSQMGEGRPRPQTVPEAIVRTLRHEVGDLLQTVYAAVAILKDRLPAECQTERRILIDMRAPTVPTNRSPVSARGWSSAWRWRRP